MLRENTSFRCEYHSLIHHTKGCIFFNKTVCVKLMPTRLKIAVRFSVIGREKNEVEMGYVEKSSMLSIVFKF